LLLQKGRLCIEFYARPSTADGHGDHRRKTIGPHRLRPQPRHQPLE
jgi:hypothetical protein